MRTDGVLFFSFTSLWSRHPVEDQIPPPWYIDEPRTTSPKTSENLTYTRNEFLEIVERSRRNCLEYLLRNSRAMDLRDVVKNKAEKHRNFYERLIENDSTKDAVATDAQMASRTPDESADCGGTQGVSRQRKQGVHEMQTPKDTITFQSVRRLRDNYTAMLEKKNKENLKHELVPPPNSGYCSSTASNNSDDEKGFVPKANVRRCGSNDSAMGQSDDDGVIGSNWGEKCEPAGEQYEEENRYVTGQYSSMDLFVLLTISRAKRRNKSEIGSTSFFFFKPGLWFLLEINTCCSFFRIKYYT